MRNLILICLVIAVLLLVIFRMKSSADPVSTQSPSSLVGPKNNQTWFFVASNESCPTGYFKPDPSKPTVCKINN